MVEVFQTNVTTFYQATLLIQQIERQCRGTSVTFDLGDCDRILRVECSAAGCDVGVVKEILQNHGFEIKDLNDTDERV